jgi:predicted nuclease with TOPRIM domain
LRTEERLNELAAAQARTEERLERLEAAVERLAEAQARTEERLNELAAAQARTEEELRKLAAEHRVTRERLEGISNTVGYTLEDRAYKALPAILAQQGIQVEGRLIRRYVQLKEKERQVDIFGHGRRNGEQVLILGEAKVRPSRREVDRFVRLARQVAAVERMPPVLVFVAYDFPPAVEAYIKEQDILPVWSYEIE